MTSTFCQSREICFACVTVKNFQTDQVSIKTDSAQMDMDRDPNQQNFGFAVCASLHAGFQTSMYTVSKHEIYVAVSLLSVVVKIAQNDYNPGK